MKEKRNCNNNMNYPVYPQYQPPFMGPMPFPNYQTYPNFNNNISQNTIEQQINNLSEQINLLDQRVTRLEKMNLNNNSYNKYNDSNYYMV